VLQPVQSVKSQKRKQSQPRRRIGRIASEIIRYQRTTDLLIRRASFARGVREILVYRHPCGLDFRWQRAAIECLQEAAEAYLVHFIGDANLLALHAKRVTLMPKDMRLLQILRGPNT